MVLLKFQSLIGNLGATLCNYIHGCRGPYAETSNRGVLASLIWPRASGEGTGGGARGGGAEGEGTPGEGAQGEGAQGEGAQGQGAEDQGAQENPGAPPSGSPSEPSELLANSDGSLPDRSSDDIAIDDDVQSPETQEVLPLSTYQNKGQGYYDKMMQAVHIDPKQEPTYASYKDRYRLRSEQRSPLDPDPEEQNDMAAVLHLEPVASRPDFGIDLHANDWTFRMLTSNGQPVPEQRVDTEDHATIVTYGSKSQNTFVVTRSDSITNDIDDPGNPAPKLPNSELIFQLLEDQAGDSVADTRFIIRHAINQKGTVAVLKNAHSSKGIAPTDMGTWTVADRDIFFMLLGTRNGRPALFTQTDHPTAMKCKVVIKIYTWAQIPDDITGKGAMVMELGSTNDC